MLLTKICGERRKHYDTFIRCRKAPNWMVVILIRKHTDPDPVIIWTNKTFCAPELPVEELTPVRRRMRSRKSVTSEIASTTNLPCRSIEVVRLGGWDMLCERGGKSNTEPTENYDALLNWSGIMSSQLASNQMRLRGGECVSSSNVQGATVSSRCVWHIFLSAKSDSDISCVFIVWYVSYSTFVGVLLTYRTIL